jgi:hypothetical protein
MPVDTLYDQFTHPERLSLVMEAMARDDWAEVKRLRESCARRTYRMSDTAFDDPLEFAADLALIFAGDVRVSLAKLRIFEGVCAMMPTLTGPHGVAAQLSFLDGWRLAQAMDPLTPPSPDVADVADVDEDCLLGEGDEGDAEEPAQAVGQQQEQDYQEQDDDEVADPTPEQVAEAERWLAPERWVAVANRRACGFYRPVIRRWPANCSGCSTRGTASAASTWASTARPRCARTGPRWRTGCATPR